MKIEHLTCKACSVAFQRKRCAPGKSPGYCSYKCAYSSHLKRKATRNRERYQLLRAAGVEPWRARLNSTGQANTDRVQSKGRTVDGAAPEIQDEFDRLWRSLDSANQAIRSLEMRAAKEGRQQAPSPDYGIAEPINFELAEGPCGCEEAVALRSRIAELGADSARLHSLLDERWKLYDATLTRLAAATALLERWLERAEGEDGLTESTSAFLAANPAASARWRVGNG